VDLLKDRVDMVNKTDVYFQILWQLVVLTITALILDFGKIMCLFELSMFIYWVTVLLGWCFGRISCRFFNYGIWAIFMGVLLANYLS